MADHINLKDLPTEGQSLDFSKVSRFAVMFLGIGLIGFIISLIILLFPSDPGEKMYVVKQSYGYSWLLAGIFLFTIAVGGVFWTLLHHASNSGWGIAVRRVFERLGSMIWLPAVILFPLLAIPTVKHTLWHWTAIEDYAQEEAAKPEVIQEYQNDFDAHKAEFTNKLSAANEAGNTHEAALVQKELDNLGEFDQGDIARQMILEKDAILGKKYAYLNQTFWWLRFFGYFVVLCLVIRIMRGWSMKQDEVGGIKLTFTMRRAACGFLPLFAVAMTFGAIDWVMAMDHHWFSTMYGVAFFAGSALSAMAVTVLVVNMLQKLGYLKGVVTIEHFHIMGKLMLAFVIFWAYISFSQFFLIWYANITEETKYFLIRNTEIWNIASIALVACHFVIPFLMLLPAWMKRNPRYLSFVACYIVVVHLLDVYLMIIPMRGPTVTHGAEYIMPTAVIGDLFALVTVSCLAAGAFLFSLRKGSLYPCRDPRLLESVNTFN